MIPRRRLMCAPHWRLVPKEIRRDIHRAGVAWLRKQTSENAHAFWDAVEAAVEIVQQLSEPTGTNERH